MTEAYVAQADQPPDQSRYRALSTERLVSRDDPAPTVYDTFGAAGVAVLDEQTISTDRRPKDSDPAGLTGNAPGCPFETSDPGGGEPPPGQDVPEPLEHLASVFKVVAASTQEEYTEATVY